MSILNNSKSSFNNRNYEEKTVEYGEDLSITQVKENPCLINSQNKLDIRVGDNQRQKWIQEKFSQKTPLQSAQSFDIENFSLHQIKNQQDERIQNYNDVVKVSESPYKNHYNQKSDSEVSKIESQSNFLQMQKLNENTPTSTLIRKGRNTIYRHKIEDEKLRKRKTKKVEDSKINENHTTENDDKNKEDIQNNQVNQVRVKKQKIWIQSFFNILFFVNRFFYRSKLRLIHFRPQYLQSHQAQAINDVSYQFNNEFENRQIVRDNIFRSKFKIVRKFRILYLIFRKKTKLCILPFLVLQNKLISLLRRVLDPIPVILPYHNFSLIWDLILLLFILVNVIKIPFEMAFNNGEISIGIISVSSKIIFFLDFFMMFNTAYYENGVLEKQRSKIFIHFFKNRLVIEALAYICLWLNPFGVSTFRVFFLIKFFSFYDTIEKLAEAFQLSYRYNFIVNLVALFIEVVFLCHLFACIWYSIGNYQQKNEYFPNWIEKYEYVDKPQYSQYIVSIYFSIVTIGTIGYGDINPQSSMEKGFLSGMAIFSCGIFAYILSNIQNVYREYMMKQEVYLNKLAQLNNYMFNREVNSTLQQMARKYLKYVHEQGFQQGVMPCDTLNSLSISLREEIKEDIFKKSINSIHFFQSFSQQLRSQLSRKMIEVNYGPDEFIMKSGQVSQPSLFYILKGQVEVCLDKGLKFGSQLINSVDMTQPFSVSKTNDIIGLYEFASQSQVSMTNAKSIGVTTVHVLNLTDFLDVLNQFSTDKEIYCQQKDTINLYKNYESIKLFCYSCKSSQHLIKDCPIFFYRPNKQRLINLFNKNTEFTKQKHERKCQQTRFNSLSIRNEVDKDVQKFCDENESQIESLFESQSSINDGQNLNENYDQNQQSNLSPLKPKSELNYMQQRRKNSLSEDYISEEDFKKIQPDRLEKNSQSFNCIQQNDINEIENEHKAKDIQNKEAREIKSEINFQEKSNSKVDQKNMELSQSRKSQKLSVSIPKNSQVSFSNINSHQPTQRISIALLEKSLNQINQKALAENPQYIKQPTNKLKNVQQQQFQPQLSLNKRQSMRSSMRVSQIQNVLNLLQTISKKDLLQQQEEIQEELITETMRTFKFYMSHNNVGIVIKQFNAFQYKNRNKEKQKMLEIISQTLQHRSVLNKNNNSIQIFQQISKMVQ